MRRAPGLQEHERRSELAPVKQPSGTPPAGSLGVDSLAIDPEVPQTVYASGGGAVFKTHERRPQLARDVDRPTVQHRMGARCRSAEHGDCVRGRIREPRLQDDERRPQLARDVGRTAGGIGLGRSCARHRPASFADRVRGCRRRVLQDRERRPQLARNREPAAAILCARACHDAEHTDRVRGTGGIGVIKSTNGGRAGAPCRATCRGSRLATSSRSQSTHARRRPSTPALAETGSSRASTVVRVGARCRTVSRPARFSPSPSTPVTGRSSTRGVGAARSSGAATVAGGGRRPAWASTTCSRSRSTRRSRRRCTRLRMPASS